VPSVEISALTGKGITDLLDMILLVAEMEDLKAETNKTEGVIIESYMDPQKGPTSTVLIEKGNLKKGDYIGTESSVGKVKYLGDFLGKEIEEADPSDPVIIIGFENVPMVGERMYVYQSIDEAKLKIKEKSNGINFDDNSNKDKKYLNLIIKADALGSIEAIREILNILPQETIGIRIIKAEVGDVSETDVRLARGGNASIISFRTKIDKIAEITAEKETTKIYEFDIIYELSQKVRELMERKLVKEKERTELGKVDVLAIFRTEKNRQIVGGNVTEGEVPKSAMLEIMRDGEKVGSGKIVGLQSGKKDCDIVKKGKESGILYQGSTRIKEGDELIIYREDYVKEQL
jgi:translation initiation factor IF-2